jgi:hypothetical protein
MKLTHQLKYVYVYVPIREEERYLHMLIMIIYKSIIADLLSTNMAVMAQSHNKFIFNENVEDYTFVLAIKVSDENDKLHNMKMQRI